MIALVCYVMQHAIAINSKPPTMYFKILDCRNSGMMFRIQDRLGPVRRTLNNRPDVCMHNLPVIDPFNVEKAMHT